MENNRLVKTHSELTSEYYKKCTEHIFNIFIDYTYPIYGADNQRNPVHIGSCFIVHDNFYKYLITASHVLKEKDSGKNNLYIGIRDSGFMHIIGQTVFLNSNNNDKDKIDIAVMKLEKSRYNDIEWGRFVSVNMDVLELNEFSYAAGVAVGYPNSKNKISKNNLFMKGLFYSSMIINNSKIFNLIGANSNDHLLLEYDRKVKNDDGIIENSIKPIGMSGGPLISFDVSNITDYLKDTIPRTKITGVLIEFHREHKVILAIKVKYVLKAIEKLAGIGWQT